METNPQVNDYGCITVAEYGGYNIDVMPMLFNHRVVVTPKACTEVYDAGWCYDSYASAVIAVHAWNPGADPEPVGYIKRVGFTDDWVRERAEMLAAGAVMPA